MWAERQGVDFIAIHHQPDKWRNQVKTFLELGGYLLRRVLASQGHTKYKGTEDGNTKTFTETWVVFLCRTLIEIEAQRSR